MEAVQDGFDEGIALDHYGYESEGSGENVFIVKNGVIFTPPTDRKSTRLNSSHQIISYAVFCLKKNIHTFSKLKIIQIIIYIMNKKYETICRSVVGVMLIGDCETVAVVSYI